MFYKKEVSTIDGKTFINWFVGEQVHTPSGVLNLEKIVNDFGWEWHDTPPQDYLDWLDSQELINFN